jgi:hypothetical protein
MRSDGMLSTIETIKEMINMDTIQAMSNLLKKYQSTLDSSTILESVNTESDFVSAIDDIKKDTTITKDELPNHVPLFNPDEMYQTGIVDDMDDEEKEWFDNYCRTCMIGAGDEYGGMVREAYAKVVANPTMENKYAMLKMGWPFQIEPTTEAFISARENLYEYVKAHSVRLIDLTETAAKMPEEDLVIEDAKELLYPVYIVCTYTYTTFGKLVTSVTSAAYSHSAIGFDAALERLYSYNMNAKARGGLSFESITGYIKDSAAAKIFVQVVFLPKRQYDKLRGNLDWYIANWKNATYSVSNLFNVVANRTKNKNHDLSMICSQFVDSMLKFIGLDITNKSSNLVTPANLSQVKNPTVYKVYEGEAKDYNPKKVQAMVNKLQRNAKPATSTVYEAAKARYDDPIVLAIYESIDRMLKARAICQEANFPLEIDDNGDLTISTYKNYETMYQETHTLLKSLDNADAIKDELCKLWFIECRLEGKIQACRNKDKQVKDKYYRLRSRVLNDFVKYKKKVQKADPEFNFSEYYKNSDYYDGSTKIKRSTLKGIGSLIKNIAL